MNDEELIELPHELEIYLDKPYGGIFEDNIQTKIVEEIVADPYGIYTQQYFEDITGGSRFNVRKALNNLIMLGLIEKDTANNLPIYRANLKSKKLVALTLLSLALIDDRDGTECMDHAILDYYFKRNKSL